METIFAALLAAGAAIIVQIVAFVLNRKVGLTEAQEAYQDTLEGMNRALSGRVTELEKTVTDLAKKNSDLEEKVSDLTKQVRDLTVENLELLRKLLERGQPRTPRSTRTNS